MKKTWFLLFLLLLSLGMTACQNGAVKEKEAIYAQAQALFQEGMFEEAEAAFLSLGTYRDSKYILSEIKMEQAYENALTLLEGKDYPGAYAALCALGDYKDSQELLDRFQVVTLTTENWDTYYEIVEVFKADPAFKTEEGHYEYMELNYVFRLKEGLQEKFYAPEQNNISFGFQATSVAQDFYFNEESGAYYYEDSEINVFTSKRVHSAMLEGEDQEIVLIADRIYSEKKGEDHAYYSCNPWGNFMAMNIEGHLYLYQE